MCVGAGILVREVSPETECAKVVQVDDVILAIEGQTVSNDGGLSLSFTPPLRKPLVCVLEGDEGLMVVVTLATVHQERWSLWTENALLPPT